jgi:hypothetical protein
LFINRQYPDETADRNIQKVFHPSQQDLKENDTSKPPASIHIVPHHPTNPAFQHEITRIWNKYEENLGGIIRRPIVGSK